MNNACGRLLRERRQEQGLTLTALATLLRVSKSYISMLESGHRKPADDQFDSLARVLEIPADVLRVSAGCLPPDVALAVPENAQTIVSAIRRDDVSARVIFPHALPTEFNALVMKTAAATGPSRHVSPYAQSLRAGKNSQAYRAHSYHTKVPPAIVDKLVRHHTSDGQLVVDPFCGSGMAGVASIMAGRHAVLSDLSPAAVHIAKNYTTPCDPHAFLASAQRLGQRIRPTLSWLYETGSPSARSRVEYTVWSDVFACGYCDGEIIYWVGGRDAATGAIAEALTCPTCKRTSHKRSVRWIGERPVETNAKGPIFREAHPPTNAELDLIERANASEILHWFPQVPFTSAREMWRAAHTSQGVDSVAGFYTRRNLQALAAIRHEIQEEKDERLRSALLFAFTGMVNRASKRYQWNVKRPTNVMTGTLYISSLRYEWNVGSLFERKIRDVAKFFAHLGTPRGRAEVVQASATALAHLPDGSVDYVFMDPPFGSNIFYADSSLLWDAWLGSLTDERAEIVVNKHRTSKDGGKSLADYQRLMTAGLGEVARVLKRDSYATMQFNNSSDEVWCAIQDAVSDAGLEIRHAVGLDKIHPSIKGVKGQQAKESIASLDSLLELRRAPSKQSAVSRAITSQAQLQEALVQFADTRLTPFTTDQAFSFLVQATLRTGGSLAGLSSQSVKALCIELFERTGAAWTTKRNIKTQAVSDPEFAHIDSPFGCVVERHLASDDEVATLLEPSRPARSADGESPRSVAGQRNTAFYNAHSYHTKVPPEAISPFLKHFTRPGDVVLDPFCGTGMTGVAAMQLGRRAILNDLSVVAAHLSHNHTRPCDPISLQEAFAEVAEDLREEFRDIYACADGKERGYVYYTLWSRDAICPQCDAHFSIWDSINRETGRMPATVKCPTCRRMVAKQGLKYAGNRPVLISYQRANGERHERAPTKADITLLNRYTDESPSAWYPRVKVDSSREMYIRSALHLQGITQVSDFYTPRNLRALASLWARIQLVKDERARAALSFAFTNTAWHGTRMRRFNARGGQRPLTGTLYIPQLSSEANVLEVMRNKIRQLRSYYEALGNPQSPPPAIRLGSATRLTFIPDGSVDYVFTDPPFGSNLFYADCNLIWESWLGGLTKTNNEAVVNRSLKPARGGKTVADYEALMSASLAEIFRVLKPGAWATLVFHNTDPQVWRAIQSAAEHAGFQIDGAGSLDRKQQSHKGYKGRAEVESVAHFDVIMSMRKKKTRAGKPKDAGNSLTPHQLVLDAFTGLPEAERSVQRVHSEILQRLARNGGDLGSVSFEDVRMHMPTGRSLGASGAG